MPRVRVSIRVRERSVPSPLEWDLGWGLWHLPLPRKFLNFIISMAFCCILGAVFKVGYCWDVIEQTVLLVGSTRLLNGNTA